MRIPARRAAAVLIACALVAGCRRNPAAVHDKALASGIAKVEAGQYREAIVNFKSAAKARPDSGDAHYRLGQAYLAVNDLGAAVGELVRAADLLPDRNEVQLAAGVALLRSGQFDDAAGRARKVLDRDIGNIDALVLLGNASAGLSNSEQAVTVLEQALRERPDDPRLNASMGALQRGRGNLQAAEQSFRNAVTAMPQAVNPRLALANFYWSVERLADAEATLKEAVTVEGKSAVASRALAVFLIVNGRDRDAEPYLTRGIDTDRDPLLQLVLADLYARTGRLDDSRKVLERLEAVPDYAVVAVARLAELDHRGGDTARGVKRLTDGLVKHPKHPMLEAVQAKLYLADDKFVEAEAAARRALEGDPKRYDALYALGTALIEQAKYEEALAPLKEAVAVAPRASAAKIQLGRLAMGRGEYEVAEQYAQDAVQVDPRSPLARLLLARVLVARGQLDKADVVVAPFRDQLSNSPQTQTLLGAIAAMRNDHAGARAAFGKALELDPNSVEAIEGLVRTELAANRPAEAVAVIGKHVTASTKEPSVLVLAASAYAAAGRKVEAEQYYKLALAVAPQRFDVYTRLATFYFTEKRLGDARQQFEALAAKDPKALGARTMVGIIQQLEGNKDQARATYERLVQERPDAPIAANNLAMLIVEGGGNLDVALTHAQAAKRMLPDHPEINDTLGQIYLKKGLGTLAATALEVSTRAEPARAEFWFHLGQAYAQAGNRAKAREALMKALAGGKDFQGADQARRLLAEVGGRAS